MRLKHQVLLSLFVAAALALLFAPNRAMAQGGGADFTRIISSGMENGKWIVKLASPKGPVTADFTRTKVFLVEKGKRRLLGHEAAMAAIQPGAMVAVKPGKREKNGIIAVLIALLKSK